MIVESPAKAKTIEKYLGKDFTVRSSFGHIRDLDKGDKGIDVEGGFIPHYVVTPEKKKVVKELKDNDSLGDLQHRIMIRKTIEFLQESAEVTEVPAAEGDSEAGDE